LTSHWRQSRAQALPNITSLNRLVMFFILRAED
jgi:hypothetical protein